MKKTNKQKKSKLHGTGHRAAPQPVQEVRAALAKCEVLGGQGRAGRMAAGTEMARACKISAAKGLGSAGKMAGCEET